MELLIVFFGFFGGYAFALVWDVVCKKAGTGHLATIKGYHFHHSLFAVPSFTAALLLRGNLTLFFLGFGIGVVAQHTLQDGFRFLTRE